MTLRNRSMLHYIIVINRRNVIFALCFSPSKPILRFPWPTDERSTERKSRKMGKPIHLSKKLASGESNACSLKRQPLYILICSGSYLTIGSLMDQSLALPIFLFVFFSLSFFPLYNK
ncbi:uncharacterized protein BYT42DRAFT_576669 [Radiomyces spectabilis]|uniref:uncharacterized protein n=1 Tax=Radiomyces spectabilis TaxID=64574 RepID=UPI00221FEB17|nr:uncharacterized protein BYT42DRAFT_576669 [Radiomyces spectabilis]KAI8374524.1 hypothetical protein BYT42DRAFT_576669 [Radiomyces spectabilis]